MTKYSPIIEKKIQMFNELKSFVRTVLYSHQEPLSVLEIHVATEALAGRKINEISVRNALARLEAAGTITSRTETMHERLLRLNGKRNTSVQARLYAAGETVPDRTQAVVIEGVQLKSGGRRPGSKNKKKTVIVKSSGKKNLDYLTKKDLLDALVEARVKELQARVAELEDRLSKIKQLS